MIQTHSAIARMRRDLTVSSLLKGLLLGGAFLAVTIDALKPAPIVGTVLLVCIGVIWMVLSYRSVKGSRMAAASPALIASGDFEQAEQHIDQALRSFSLFRTVKLRSLHHLAILRHAQRRWGETAILCQALLAERLGALSGLSRSTRLILADSLLEVGDLRGVYEALADLYRQRLSLGEALELTAVQLDYESRLAAWEQMLRGAARKIELAELMASARSTRTLALLALAARKTGQKDLESLLRRRVDLLADRGELIAQRPVLSELWE